MLNGVTVGVSLKAYLGLGETEQWLADVRRMPVPAGLSLFVLPSFPAISLALRVLAGTGVLVGGQDVSSEQPGPWTGEVTARMLADTGASYAEIGHSERRRRHGETDAAIVAKVARSQEAGLIPVLCVGEPRCVPVDAAADLVREQLSHRLAGAVQGSELVVAYEPEWAIGGTEAATPDRVAAVTAAIRAQAERAHLRIRVLYGGSASEGVYPALSAAAEPRARPDGLFLGRAALDVSRLAAIVREVARVAGCEAA